MSLLLLLGFIVGLHIRFIKVIWKRIEEVGIHFGGCVLALLLLLLLF